MMLLNVARGWFLLFFVSVLFIVPSAKANDATNGSDSVAALILDSARTDDLIRLATIEVVGREKKTQYIPQLLHVAESEKEMRAVRIVAMEALGRLGAVESIPLFRSIVAAAHRDRQSSWGLDTHVGSAFSALADIGTEDAVAILADALQTLEQMDLDGVQLAILIRGLGQVKHSPSVEKIAEYLLGNINNTRSIYAAYRFQSAAIYALGEIGTAEAIDVLSRFSRQVPDEELFEIAHKVYLKSVAQLCRNKLE